jgi:hypothetical protein
LRLAAPLAVLVLVPIAVPGLLASSSGTARPGARGGGGASCTVTGLVAAGQTRLPGVEVTATPHAGGTPVVTSTGLDGVYTLVLPAAGAYDLKAELAAFATVTRELAADKTCGARVDLMMTLTSRVPAASKPAAAGQPQAAVGTTAPATGAPKPAARPQGTAGQRQGPQFQRVGASATGTQAELSVTADDATAVAQHLNLPPGFSADTMSDTVTAFGQTGQTNEMMLFGPGGEGLFGGQRGDAQGIPGMPGTGADPTAAGGIGGGPGGGGRGGGGFAGGPGGGRGGMGGGGQRGGGAVGDRLNFANRMRQGQLQGQASYQVGGSPFDAAPYSLNGRPVDKPSTLQQRITASVGGQFKVPHLFDLGPRTSFFLNYTGNHSSNAYSAYSNVPTDAERAGNFSASSVILNDPLTHQPFQGNTIPTDRLDPTALALLQYIPRANQPGTIRNFYYSTTTATSADDINFRFIRQFGAQTRRGQRGGGGGMGGGGGRGGGGGGGGTNVNFSVHYHRQESTQATPFGTSSGTSSQTGWDIPVGISFTTWGIMNQVRADYNVNNTSTTNAYAGVTNAAGQAGLEGISSDPFDWGLPTVSFSGFSSLTDITPSSRHAQTFTLNDGMIRSVKRHNLRWGFGFTDTRLDSRTDANARGAYAFTGAFTTGATATQQSGADFADFLLGLPQSATAQYGPGTERFRSQSLNAYFQDDWRLSSNLTLNLGVRYEYQAPYSEADNRLVNLDVNSGFTAAVPVVAGQSGPYYGQFSTTFVNPDRHAFAPRLSLAWRPKPKWVVRGGYGINYSSVPYLQIAQKLAGQPPFATTNGIYLTPTSAPLPLSTILLTPTSGTTNTFGVDPNYNIGYVQLWNADVQRDLTQTLNVGVTYIGTHGSSLDILRAPNRQPDGTLLITGVSPFIWESSGGISNMHAFSFRARKRLSQGYQVGGTYTYSRAFDNASTLGGGGGVVAQNDKDLAAEYGPSSFDIRHRFTSDFSLELPFGSNRRWLTREGLANEIFGGWMLNGTLSFSSGSPFTALVAGSVNNVSTGVNGTLRADYNGQPIALSNPTTAQFFNTAAFSLPADGTFGTAGRNTIIGPPQRSFNMALMKNFTVRGLRTLSLRIQANNVLNMVVWRGINTTQNSQGFGQVTSVGQMRSVQIVLRAGF